jgi:hypothetical protein
LRVVAGPARREGSLTTIYDRPAEDGNFGLDRDGNLMLTFDACGINCPKSLYRYQIRFTPDCVQKLIELLSQARNCILAGAIAGLMPIADWCDAAPALL